MTNQNLFILTNLSGHTKSKDIFFNHIFFSLNTGEKGGKESSHKEHREDKKDKKDKDKDKDKRKKQNFLKHNQTYKSPKTLFVKIIIMMCIDSTVKVKSVKPRF